LLLLRQAENFQQVAPLASLTVTSIAVGAFHNLAVTSDGECFPVSDPQLYGGTAAEYRQVLLQRYVALSTLRKAFAAE
jgi:hypothetical protein